MKIKETIENLKDLRRNLWISVIGIIGGLAALFLKTTTFKLGWLFVLKASFVIISILISLFFINEIICCNKSIIKLVNSLKEKNING